jgi:hypothetical protein
MRGVFGLRAGAIVAVLGSLFCTASATTVERLDFKGLTAYATNVVIGTVGGSRVERTPDGGMIVTLVDLAVEQQWKGVIDVASITINVPGGRIGNEVIEMSGVPVLERGQQALLFLEKNPNGTYGVISFAQGSYKLGVDAVTGAKVATRDLGAMSLLAVRGKEVAQIVDGVWTLDTIQQDVTAAVKAGLTKESIQEVNAVDAVPLNDVVVEKSETGKGGGK